MQESKNLQVVFSRIGSGTDHRSAIGACLPDDTLIVVGDVELVYKNIPDTVDAYSTGTPVSSRRPNRFLEVEPARLRERIDELYRRLGSTRDVTPGENCGWYLRMPRVLLYHLRQREVLPSEIMVAAAILTLCGSKATVTCYYGNEEEHAQMVGLRRMARIISPDLGIGMKPVPRPEPLAEAAK